MKNIVITRRSFCGSVLALATLACSGVLPALSAPTMPQLIPQPTKMTLGAGAFTLTPKTILVATGKAQPEARLFSAAIAPALGAAPRLVATATGPSAIVFTLDPKAPTGDEGYRLKVTPQRVTVVAAKPAGLFYGAQTLRQLLPTQIFAPTKQTGVTWTLPAITIEDAPRFAWRGLMLDCGRHFFPVADVKRFIDEMALHKFNTFHWHLTEDQGWRLQIKKYPRLTEIGSKRTESPQHDDWQKGDGVPYGGFYTQDEARAVVAYAAARHITVVPEIEMPGHAAGAIASYPQLGNTDVPNYDPQVSTHWGVFPYTYAPKPETFAFLEDVLREVMAIFPSTYIHIGGDEAPTTQWDQSATARAVMTENHLKNGHELQTYFMQHIGKFLNAHGRKYIGWDEILEGGLPPNAAVMSWRGEAGAAAAAEQDHPVVMASNSAYYFDYRQDNTPGNPGGILPLRRVYNFDPEAAIPADKRHWLLGVQGQLWTEHIWDRAKLERMTYPRACALAETGWSQNTTKDYGAFMVRLQTHVKRLKSMGVNFFPLEVYTPPVASWKSGEIGETPVVKEWDITPNITKAGDVEARFQYSGGAQRLDIAWAELLQNGQPVARDEHAGLTGGATKDNVYHLPLPTFPAGAKYTLRAQVRADGGNDSNGDIFVVVK
ncbi:MAG: beta-N-acetylhexosaminidase [Armatimonadota bacterium]|nr:beta-N-acetylhexosaminidase [Armatimonadota bacterium]